MVNRSAKIDYWLETESLSCYEIQANNKPNTEVEAATRTGNSSFHLF
ncbi:MAG: hypothetical protein R3C17_06180 [Planctomycetaceae bacterium]